jgi:Fe-S-cluster containining protein
MKYLDYCLNCPRHAHCCIPHEDEGDYIFISINDAFRVKKATGLKFSEFINSSPLPEVAIKERHSDILLEMLVEGKILRLKTKPNGECIFLGDDGRCQIYRSRPQLCRMYPFGAEEKDGGMEIRLFDQESEKKSPRTIFIILKIFVVF